ncbi:PadR family transcriptional regulator [Aneurinibacillus danicus]|uniref:PadR family transcriptional regulator n=1 Tax=Aneurinibacillus danicus TaxID=267746 RepID=A0A511V9M9_9BACL|nr:PadR family transcriptional regulator [Aneurinibacillus danicus]GEN34961.1 PadR family transcriptional regulator [Aneurinibacillus danicus]
MNALGYALLGMLVRKPCSGYELTQLLEVFWQAKHSQVYPLLMKLEQDGLVTFVYVKQTGKPDKKIYSITDKGKALLAEWTRKSPAPPVIRDEFLAKVYSIWLTDKDTAQRLFHERMTAYEEKIAFRKEEIKKMKEEYGDEIESITSRHFGRYLLFCRKLKQEEEEIAWCRWVLGLLAK